MALTTLRPRDVTLRYSEHERADGIVTRVVLEHKATGLKGEGLGKTFDEAKAMAEADLEAKAEAERKRIMARRASA
jgi:hypothetical protein